VVPGFGGQSFMSEVLPKISQAAQWRQDRGLAYHIEVDGGINPDTAALSIAAGANVLVAGSSVFSSADMAAVIRAMRA
jgi:ribulose-phosphate 3-epimerase